MVAAGSRPKLPNHARVIVGMDLLGACGGAEKAGGPVQALAVGLDGKCGVLRMGVRLALIGGLQIAQGDFIFNR